MTAEVGQYGLPEGSPPCSLQKVPPAKNALQVEKDDFRFGILGQVLQKIGFIKIGPVPDGGHLCDAGAQGRHTVQKYISEHPALCHNGNRSGLQILEKDLAGGKPVRHVYNPNAVRPHHPDSGLTGDLPDLLLHPPPLFSCLGKSRTHYNNRPYLLVCTFLQNGQHGRSRNHDAGQIHLVRKLTDGRIYPNALDFLQIRVDRVDPVSPPVFHKEIRQAVTEPERPAHTDQCHLAGMKKSVDVPCDSLHP